MTRVTCKGIKIMTVIRAAQQGDRLQGAEECGKLAESSHLHLRALEGQDPNCHFFAWS